MKDFGVSFAKIGLVNGQVAGPDGPSLNPEDFMVDKYTLNMVVHMYLPGMTTTRYRAHRNRKVLLLLPNRRLGPYDQIRAFIFN